MRSPTRGIYWLPNLLTTAALFSGFYAIIAGLNAQYEQGAMAIFVAMIFDALDGRVARLTNASSDFGAEYDSLSDMVSFGVAPAILMYSWGLQNMGKIGWVVAFIYVASAALRLARFNTQIGVSDRRYFQGLPSPAAAGLLAGFVWVVGDGTLGQLTVVVAMILTVFAGVLMVSNFRYHSFKEFRLKERVPFITLLLIVAVGVVILIDPPSLLLMALSVYAVSGLVITLMGLKERRAARVRQKQQAVENDVALESQQIKELK